MEFGSTFVYNYSDSEEEWVSDDEFEEGMTYGTVEQFEGSTKKRVKAAGAAGSLLSSLSALPQRLRAKLHGGRNKKEKQHHWMSRGFDTVDSGVPKCASAASHGKHCRRADTNIVEVSFNQLTAPSNMHTGDPVYCDGCKAVLSAVSKVERNEDTQVWKCEFCEQENVVDLMDDEIPKKNVVTYMLQPAVCTTSSGRTGLDESLVIFCIDVSGSMCVTTEVAGSVKLRGDRTSSLQGLNTDHSRQRLPGEKNDVTYVSRLQGVQAAVDHQLAEMQQNYPDRRAAIITFNNEVVVIGDGSGSPNHISGDKLSDKDELVKIGEKQGLPKAVKDSRRVLGDKVFDLEEGGQTALGPALLVAVAMACQLQGSKVIICTDGMANIGLGCLNMDDEDDNAYDAASEFYTQVGQMAVDKGVSVSVISIKGTSCKLVELGQVAEATQGQVNIVDPLKLTEEFGSILANPVIATNVIATMLLHKRLYFRHEYSKESRIEQNVGNVTKDTNVTFEYGVRREFRKHATEEMTVPSVENPLYQTEGNRSAQGDGNQVNNPQASGKGSAATTDTAEAASATAAATAEENVMKHEETLTEFPFQLQLEYTDLDGAKALLVRSQTKPITNDRKEAEKEMNIGAVGAHATQISAKLALKGNFTQSRMNAFMFQRLVRRHTYDTGQEDLYECYYDNVAPIEEYVNLRQQSEQALTGHHYSDDDDEDDDDDDDDECVQPMHLKTAEKSKEELRSKKGMVSRRRECSDEGAMMLYGNLKTSSGNFVKK